MSRDQFWARRRRSVLATCATAAALALGACGGGDEESATTASETESDEAAVEQVVTDFGAAEGSDACDFVSQAYLDGLGGTAGCDKEFAEAVAVDYAVSDVQVDGETATATAETDDTTVAFELVLVDGEWRISSAGPPDEGATTESDDAAVEQVVADFGLAEGDTACDYVSQEYLDGLGGESGCDKEFAEAVGVKYEISDIQVNGDKATAQAATNDQDVAFELVREDGVWKISSAGPPDEGTTTESETESPEAAVEQTIIDYGIAEGSAACEYLTQEYIDLLAGEGGCEENVRTELDVSKVQVNADKATALAETGGTTNRYELVLEDGEWKISLVGAG